MDYNPGYNETVVCPYNKAHVILRSRFLTHLARCARNYPHSELVECPFDFRHRIMPDDLQVCALKDFCSHDDLLLIFITIQAHKIDCPSRASFDHYRNNVQNWSHLPCGWPTLIWLPPDWLTHLSNCEHAASFTCHNYNKTRRYFHSNFIGIFIIVSIWNRE